MAAHPDATTTDVATPQLVIEQLTWRRVQASLVGRIEAGGPNLRLDACEVSFVLPETERRAELRAPLRRIQTSGDRFSISFNAMQALDQYPLPAGVWELHVTDPATGTGIPVRMQEGFAIDAASYGGRFGRYWVLPTADPLSGAFQLAINRGAGTPRDTSLAARGKRGLKLLRTALFTGTFRLTQLLVRRNGHRILFTSDSREDLSGNLLDIHARMRERGLDREYRLLTMFKASILHNRRFADKFRFPAYLAMADVVVLDDFHPEIYKLDFPPDVKIMQVWHASGAFKTVGYSRVGKPGGPAPFSNGHKNYTHAIVSSEHDVPFYAEAFGIPEDRVIPTGIPRMDLFFDEAHRERQREVVYATFPQLRGKKVILFAPTFRGKGPSDAHYDYDRIDFAGLHAVCEEQDAMMVFKMHPFVIEPLGIRSEFRDRFVDAAAHREVNDLLFVADLVVTDYSSLVFEYSVLDRPMLFFAYDLEEYIATRDFYENFEQFVPGRIVRTSSELIDAIRSGEFDQHKVAEFARAHFGHLDSGSTDRVIDLIVSR